MLNVKELVEKRAKIGKEIKRLADTLTEEKPELTAEENATWVQVNKDFDALGKSIEIATRAAEVGASQGDRSGIPGNEDTPAKRNKSNGSTEEIEEAQALAMQAWFRKQAGKDLRKEHKDACKFLRFNPNKANLDIGLPTNQKRAGLLTTSGNGDLIPQGFIANFEQALLAHGGVRAEADVMRTTTGNPLPWPTGNDTGNVGELVAEAAAVTEEVNPTLSSVTFNAYKFSSKSIKVSYELLEDSAFDLPALLGEMLGERIGRGQSPYFVTGTGSSQPQGLIAGGASGVTAAATTSIAADELISLYHSVDPALRDDPSFRFFMHDSVLMAIRKLKDSNNNYLVGDLSSGQPTTLLGKPVVILQQMASSIAASAKTVACGCAKKFKIRDVGVVRFRRLDELYAINDQVGFLAFMRSDSKLLNAGTNPIKYITQAAS